ncbi:hypothetical protein GCM10009422_11190 [Brevundimonas kwangchunensis]|uniref:Uncharacterized protein n=1 Tax=Brevundimonas kwangchunensis TaxID=322163 RepID=A0ABN1GRW2_9CAUL
MITAHDQTEAIARPTMMPFTTKSASMNRVTGFRIEASAAIVMGVLPSVRPVERTGVAVLWRFARAKRALAAV